ncbi:MAG TPA: hypothetical protein ENK57_04060 [Polyangiaceae bacterium]|nr:hypothetical protein [Polyangiaceae bacterium]
MAAINDRVHEHPANRAILAWLRVSPDAPLRPWVESGFDPGAPVLFYDLGARIPEVTRFTLGTANICVHVETGVIFAMHYGRYTFFVRRVSGAARSRDLLCTLDGDLDVSTLEPHWTGVDLEDEGEVDTMFDAYRWAGRQVAEPAERAR